MSTFFLLIIKQLWDRPRPHLLEQERRGFEWVEKRLIVKDRELVIFMMLPAMQSPDKRQ